MQEIFNYIASPSTLISLVFSLCAFYTSYKMLEVKVNWHDEKIKEVQWEVREVREDVKGIDVAWIKAQLAAIQVDLKWLIESKKKEK